MVVLSHLARNVPTPSGRVLPPEPVLPAFHKLTRPNLAHMADIYLAGQEEAVFKAFVAMVANRSARDDETLGDLRGSLAREIRGLENLRAEFEGPGTEPPPVDPDISAVRPPQGPEGESSG